MEKVTNQINSAINDAKAKQAEKAAERAARKAGNTASCPGTASQFDNTSAPPQEGPTCLCDATCV